MNTTTKIEMSVMSGSKKILDNDVPMIVAMGMAPQSRLALHPKQGKLALTPIDEMSSSLFVTEKLKVNMQFTDLTSPAFYADPYPFYQQIRAQGPVVNLAPRLWVTANYSVVDALLRDRRMSRSYIQNVRAGYGDMLAQERIFSTLDRMLLLMDPPHHTRLRSLLIKAFTARQEEEFRRLAQTIADRHINRLPRSGTMDLVRDYAIPLPLEMICALLDVPFDDAAIFRDAINAIAQSFEMVRLRRSQIHQGNEAINRLEEYFRPVLHDRRKRPGNDLISLMAQAEDNGEQLIEEEILANIILLFLAGHETTANMIGNSLIALHRHPEELARAVADPELLSGVVMECLRYDTSVQTAMRTALEDMEIEGQRIASGDRIFSLLGAANRDPEKFELPDSLIIDRASKNIRSFSFGAGIHHCLGIRLAVIELEIALSTLFRRLPAMKIIGIDSLQWYPRNALRGVESLNVVW